MTSDKRSIQPLLSLVDSAPESWLAQLPEYLPSCDGARQQTAKDIQICRAFRDNRLKNCKVTVHYSCESNSDHYTALQRALEHNNDVYLQYFCRGDDMEDERGPGDRWRCPCHTPRLLEPMPTRASQAMQTALHALTRINLMDARLKEFFPSYISTLCPSLKHLTFSNVKVLDWPKRGASLPTFKNTQQLELRGLRLPSDRGDDLRQLTAHMCCLPNLESFSIVKSDRRTIFPLQCLGASVKKLSICGMHPPELHGVSKCRNLVQLDWHTEAVDDSVFEHAMRLPRLKKLYIKHLYLNKPDLSDLQATDVELSCKFTTCHALAVLPADRIKSITAYGVAWDFNEGGMSPSDLANAIHQLRGKLLAGEHGLHANIRGYNTPASFEFVVPVMSALAHAFFPVEKFKDLTFFLHFKYDSPSKQGIDCLCSCLATSLHPDVVCRLTISTVMELQDEMLAALKEALPPQVTLGR